MTPRAVAVASVLIGLGIAADQATKAWAVSTLRGTRGMDVISGALSFVYVENPNAAFGLGRFLPDAVKPYALLALTGVLTIVLAVAMYRSTDLASQLGFGVTIAGAVGNIIDRVRVGHVVDFIYWHGGFTWPNFNVADILVCTGVGILLVFGGRKKDEPKKAPAATSA